MIEDNSPQDIEDEETRQRRIKTAITLSIILFAEIAVIALTIYTKY